MAEGFTKSGKAVVAILGLAVSVFIAGVVTALAVVAPAKANAPTGYATASQVDQLKDEVVGLRGEVRDFNRRVGSVELEQARQQGARDAALRR